MPPTAAPERVTQASIAQQLGMSKSTVSMILSNHPQAARYSEGTRRRVLETAAQLNYRPDFFASQVRSSKRKMLALCLSRFQDSFGMGIADAFAQRASELGYQLLVTAANQSAHGQPPFGEIVGPHGVTALAIVGSWSEQVITDTQLIDLAQRGVSVTLIGRRLDHPAINYLTVDHYQGQRSAAAAVLARGAKNIWLLHYGQTWSVARQRVAAVRAALAEQQLTPARTLAVDSSSINEAYLATQAALRESAKPDAVVAIADNLAIGAMEALVEANLTPGKDVLVTGYDDTPLARVTRPRLASVRLPLRELGRQGADVLIEHYEGTQPAPSARLLPTEFIARASIGEDQHQGETA